jgi:hypothetical protein
LKGTATTTFLEDSFLPRWKGEGTAWNYTNRVTP